MEMFKINYNKLSNLPQLNFIKLAFSLFIIIIILFIFSINLEVYKKFECYGIFSNNTLNIKINSELSDELVNTEYLIFKNKKIKFRIEKLGNYEIVDNVVLQEIELKIDKEFIDNEIGLVEFYYDKKILFKYILDLFK